MAVSQSHEGLSGFLPCNPERETEREGGERERERDEGRKIYK